MEKSQMQGGNYFKDDSQIKEPESAQLINPSEICSSELSLMIDGQIELPMNI